jgi:hypothetical protein
VLARIANKEASVDRIAVILARCCRIDGRPSRLL